MRVYRREGGGEGSEPGPALRNDTERAAPAAPHGAADGEPGRPKEPPTCPQRLASRSGSGGGGCNVPSPTGGNRSRRNRCVRLAAPSVGLPAEEGFSAQAGGLGLAFFFLPAVMRAL